MKSKLSLLLFLFVILSACKKESMPIDLKTIEVKIKNTETYTYRTGIGGDEESVLIKSQASNFEISELKRDISTNFEVVYYYKPKSNFSGFDNVEIETNQIALGSNTRIKKKLIKFVFQIN